MTSLKKITPFAWAFTLAFALAILIGALSLLTNTPKTEAATSVVEPQGSCSAVTINNIQTQSVALGQAEKITVNWTFTPPSGADSCVKVQNFEVWIEVTHRSGRKSNRKIDASATANSVNAEFTEAGIGALSDEIKSVKAIVTANLVATKGEKVLSGL
jgi:hypothetical protein